MVLALWLSLLASPASGANLQVLPKSSPPASPVDLVGALPEAAHFESLSEVPVSAGFGHTVRVYGHRSGWRTQEPIAILRVDPSGTPRLLTHFERRPVPVAGSPIPLATLQARFSSELSHPRVGPVRWWALGDRLHPARAIWSDTPAAGLQHPVLLVDALTGAVLLRRDDTTHATKDDPPQSARVFPVDPVRTPTTEVVSLPSSTHLGLVSPHFTMHNCTDLGTTYGTNSDLGEVDLRQCEWVRPEPVEEARWLFAPEPWPEDPALDEDAFSGPHILWHGEETLRDFVELGLPLADRPETWQRLWGQSNRRTTDLYDEVTMSDPESPLMPYDNAFFRRGRERSDGSLTHPEVVFGQGTVGDFAYDADVIIHELGHFAVWTQGGPSGSRSSDHGSTAEPGALNEGLADYFAAVRTDDPEIGTYSGESLGRPWIRTLDGTARCPESLYGQVHADSQPFSQALWEARSALEADQRPLLDRAVMDALPSIGPEGSFADATRAIEAEVRLQLGEETAHRVATAFAERSVPECEPWLPVENGVEARAYTLLPPFYADLYDRPIPGYVQFVIPDDGPLALTIRFEQEQSLEVDLWGTNMPDDVLLLHRSGGPITHTPYQDEELERWVWAHDGDEVGTATHIETLDMAIDGRSIDHLYGTTVVLIGDGPHWVQLAHLAERSVTARDLTFTWEPAPEALDSGDAAGPRPPPEGKDGVCACRGDDRSRSLPLLLPLLGLPWLRRRRER